MGAVLLLPLAIIGAAAVGTVIALIVQIVKLKNQKNALETAIENEKNELKVLRKEPNMKNMSYQSLLSELVKKKKDESYY